MAKKIQDEFTNLPTSREMKRQLRKIKIGLCPIAGCKAKAATGRQLCKRHAKKENERQQKYKNAAKSAEAPAA